MKRAAFLFIAVILFSTVQGQLPAESQQFLTESLSGRRDWDERVLDDKELLPQFLHFDFTALWTEYDKDILGIIGDSCQRLNIKYLAIVKNADNPGKYYVSGKSRVKTNICQFVGEIELIHVRMFAGSDGVERYYDTNKDGDTGEFHLYPQYSLLAEYRFFESPNQDGAGILRGILRSNFYLDSGNVFYDKMRSYSDGWCNNQCVGTWTSYAGGVSKKCNWGEWRVPYSGDLDWGAGVFSPNPKYSDRGWDTYPKAFTGSDDYDTTARAIEEEEWWRIESPPAEETGSSRWLQRET